MHYVSAQMSNQLLATDLKTLFEAAHRYLEGSSSVHELNGIAGQCIRTAQMEQAAPAILSVLEDWRFMINRRWNESGLEKEPLSQAEFLVWLKEQLLIHSASGRVTKEIFHASIFSGH